MVNEFELLQRIRKRIPFSQRGTTTIQDDAAVFRPEDGKSFLLATDVLVEGVDFLQRRARPEWVGRKALAVNLSDIAAMGGEPQAFLVALGLPKHIKERWIDRFYIGLMAMARKYGTKCLGGDLSKSKTLFIAVTVLGSVRKNMAVLRSGAQIGNYIGVTGTLGGSILGKHFHFTPRLREAGFITKYGRPTSMIDISDGFVQDLGHILKQSGVSAEIDLQRIPISRLAKKASKGNRERALRHALHDGEDFELIFTVPAEGRAKLDKKWKNFFPDVPLSWTGRITKGNRKIVWTRQGKRVANPIGGIKGYDHFK